MCGFALTRDDRDLLLSLNDARTQQIPDDIIYPFSEMEIIRILHLSLELAYKLIRLAAGQRIRYCIFCNIKEQIND